MTHEEIKILVSAYIDGEVTPSEKTIVQEHLSTCESCQKDHKMYMAMSSSLSKWSDEALSPDEEIKVQKRFEQRRESMFSQRNMMVMGTTLALTVIIGSVLQTVAHRQLQSRLKSAADDVGDQYSSGNIFQYKARIHDARTYFAPSAMAIRKSTQYEPYYLKSGSMLAMDSAKRLGSGLVTAGPMVQAQAIMANQAARYEASPAFAPTPASQGFAQQINDDRKVIRNAQITLKVQNAQQTQNALQDLVGRHNGIVNSLNMDKLEDGSRRGVMVFSVTPQSLDIVLTEIRKLGEVDSENQSASDVTNQYSYLQSRLTTYEVQRQRLQKDLKKSTPDSENNLYLEGQISNIEENMNALQSSLKELDKQSFMSTVTVNFYDTIPVVTPKAESLKDRTIATLKDNLKNTLETSYNIAVNSFSGIVIVLSFLIQIGLWALLFWGIYLIVKKFFK